MKLIPNKKQLKSPLVWLEIDIKKIIKNIISIKKIVKDKKIMTVLKADAYGIGADNIASYIEPYVDSFGVVGITEAKKLRKIKIKKPIINLGIYNPDDADAYIENDIIPTIFTDTDFKNYEKKVKTKNTNKKIWIKIDTGLCRLGIPYQDAFLFIKNNYKSNILQINGSYSTLTEDLNFDELQLNRLQILKKQCEKEKINIPNWSIASSAAVFMSNKYSLDMVRIGIPIFGFYPSKEAEINSKINLKPAITYKTRVACIKELAKNESVFYRRTFIAKEKTRIAILLPGYSYGIDPKLVNGGNVLIRGRKYPLIGGISATNSFADIGMKNKVEVGDEVVIFGRQKNIEIKLEELCKTLNQNAYQILSRIPEKVKRVYKYS